MSGGGFDDEKKRKKRKKKNDDDSINNTDDGFVTSTVSISIPLHPSKLGNRKKGVREQLDAKTLRHHDGFGGVLVKYTDLKMNEEGMGETILPNSAYVEVKATVKATVFAPKVKAVLIGKVNKIGQDHIGLVVGNIFNASIPIENFKENMMFDETKEAWEIIEDGTENLEEEEEDLSDKSSSMSMKEIKVGARVKFRVERVNREDDRVVLLIGSLLGKGCGPVDRSSTSNSEERNDNDEDEDVEADDEEEAERDKKRNKKEKKEKKEKKDSESPTGTPSKEKKEKKEKKRKEPEPATIENTKEEEETKKVSIIRCFMLCSSTSSLSFDVRVIKKRERLDLIS